MSKMTLGNAIGSQLVGAMQDKNKAISNASKDITTGLKSTNDVVSSFLARNLERKYAIGEAINSNTDYFKNILNLAGDTYDFIEKELVEISSTLKKAAGASDSNKEMLNSIMEQKFKNINRIVNNAEFDGNKVVSGEAGFDPKLSNVNETHATTLKSLTTSADFYGLGTAGNATITVNNTIADGDTIQVGGDTFTARKNKAVLKSNEFSIDSTSMSEVAQGLLGKILSSNDEATKGYKYNIAGAVITVSQASVSENNVQVVTSDAANMLVTPTAATKSAIDVSGITDIDSFVDNLKLNFKLVGDVSTSAGGAEEAAILAAPYSQAANDALGTGAANDGAHAIIIEVSHAGKTFTGALYDSGNADLKNYEMEMKNEGSGESFIVNWSAATAQAITDKPTAQTAVDSLNTMVKDVSFGQLKYLDVYTGGGEIAVGGKSIASTTGLTVSYDGVNNNNLTVNSFDIKAGDAAGDVKFTAVIDGKNFSQNVVAGNIGNMVKGFALELSEEGVATPDKLVLNLGNGGLTSLSEPENYQAVEDAFYNALTKQGQGFNIVVSNSGDKMNIQIPSAKETSMLTKNDGSFVASSTLNIGANGDIALAEEVVNNAIDYISKGKVKITNMSADLESASDLLSSINQMSLEASKSFSEADMNEAAQEFTKNLNQIQAMLSVVRANESVVRNILQNLQNLG